ncbi:MAG: endonuclease III, partial [Erysipelotrichaceae bacterium]|nr:endonuclease III [Erysipelotrichaceae bacterium]
MKNSELIIRSLNQLFPDAKCELNHANHFELLIAVVLSAQTTDERVNSVTPELFKKYPDAFALAKADLKDVEQIIRPIGLYHNKAVNIIKLSKVLCEYYDGQVPSEREDLESL